MRIVMLFFITSIVVGLIAIIITDNRIEVAIDDCTELCNHYNLSYVSATGGGHCSCVTEYKEVKTFDIIV